jgi:hypothetical protein
MNFKSNTNVRDAMKKETKKIIGGIAVIIFGIVASSWIFYEIGEKSQINLCEGKINDLNQKFKEMEGDKKKEFSDSIKNLNIEFSDLNKILDIEFRDTIRIWRMAIRKKNEEIELLRIIISQNKQISVLIKKGQVLLCNTNDITDWKGECSEILNEIDSVKGRRFDSITDYSKKESFIRIKKIEAGINYLESIKG